jgi:hypothetical protein
MALRIEDTSIATQVGYDTSDLLQFWLCLSAPGMRAMSHNRWSRAERWAWDQICNSNVADFSKKLCNVFDPESAAALVDDRLLSASFVRDMFYDKSLADQIPPEGVRIAGAWFKERLNLPFAHLHRQLWLEACTFDRGIDLSGHTNESSLSLERSLIVSSAGGLPAVNLQMASIGGRLSLEGAVVRGALEMGGVRVGQDLVASALWARSEFVEVNIVGANIEGSLSLDGATVAGKLTLRGLRIGQCMVMRGGEDEPATFAEVDLAGANVEGDLAFDGATVHAELTMNGLRVGQDLSMQGTVRRPATFAKNVDLTGTNIEGQLTLNGATVKGKLMMNGLHVGRHLFMGGSSGQRATSEQRDANHRSGRFAEVDLTNANIDGQLCLIGTLVTEKLTMTGMQVGESLFMRTEGERTSQFCGEVDLSYAKVTRGVYLDGARFVDKLKLISTEILGEFRLNGVEWPALKLEPTRAPMKIDDVRLTLLGTHAAVLHQDARWPRRVELDGFTYDHIRAVEGSVIDRATQGSVIGRKDFLDHYIRNWLMHDATYTPQPYEQLAAVFRAAGQPERAADALYESRKLAQQRAFRDGDMLRYLGLLLLKWTIGYGLGFRFFWWPLGWIVGLTIVGTFVLAYGAHDNWAFSGHGIGPVKIDAVLYSLLRLVPLFGKLEEFGAITFSPWARWYFYFHQFAGYTLAGFIAAGVAGLTQKS